MKKVYGLLLTLGVILFCSNASWAQLNTPHAVGGRFGSATGFSYRYSLTPDRAIEGILSVQSNSKSRRFRLVGLYQYHKPIAGDFSWFYGFGGSIGSFRYKDVVKTRTDEHGNTYSERVHANSELALSIDGIVGVEYAIPTTPLAVSVDVKPYFDFLQESTIKIFDPFALTIRYTF